jgi:NAD(P)-dependent dehydrogenase (short-subunit alcohol dehydrogenase family)
MSPALVAAATGGHIGSDASISAATQGEIIMSSAHTVIAGGSSGIGLATARRLLSMDHRVTLMGRSEERLQAARKSLNGEVAVVAADGADAPGLGAVFAGIGSFDHLVLAFGSGKGVGPFATVDLAEVRQGFEEKVFPHFACAQAALPFLSKAGSITFVSAVSAHAAVPGTAGIGAANAAVAALVPILAVELRPLRVNAVSPGVIDTPWWDAVPADQKALAFADFGARTPVGRIGQADDVAQAIAFLVGDGFMNAHVLVCDGGLRLTA